MVLKLDQQQCAERFEQYERITKDKYGAKTSEILIGARSDKKGYLHKEVNEYGIFETNPIDKEIPGGKKSKFQLLYNGSSIKIPIPKRRKIQPNRSFRKCNEP